MSSRAAFLFSQNNRTLLPISKMESIPVASRDSDRDEIAAYTAKTMRNSSCTQNKNRTVTLQYTQTQICDETGIHCDFDLEAKCVNSDAEEV